MPWVVLSFADSFLQEVLRVNYSDRSLVFSARQSVNNCLQNISSETTEFNKTSLEASTKIQQGIKIQQQNGRLLFFF